MIYQVFHGAMADGFVGGCLLIVLYLAATMFKDLFFTHDPLP